MADWSWLAVLIDDHDSETMQLFQILLALHMLGQLVIIDYPWPLSFLLLLVRQLSHDFLHVDG